MFLCDFCVTAARFCSSVVSGTRLCVCCAVLDDALSSRETKPSKFSRSCVLLTLCPERFVDTTPTDARVLALPCRQLGSTPANGYGTCWERSPENLPRDGCESGFAHDVADLAEIRPR